MDKRDSEPIETIRDNGSVVTVEVAAYVALGILAAGLRWFQLGAKPLSEGEAAQALAAFRFVQAGIQTAPGGTIPALFTSNVLGFSLVGASDISARWLPALAGFLLTLLPYWLRHRLGRIGALAASLLLALSPSVVHFSRVLDGAVVVGACALAIAVGWINYSDARKLGYLYLVAAALGLGLCAGPMIFTLLLIAAAFAALLYVAAQLPGFGAGWSSLQGAWRTAAGEKDVLLKAGAVLAASFGLVATTFVLHPAGVGNAADLIGAWVLGFAPEEGGNPAIYPLLLLARYEPLILLFGAVEMGRAVWKRQTGHSGKSQTPSSFPHTAFLTFWTIAAVLVVSISGPRPAGNILLAVVPLALLAGQGIERAGRWLVRRSVWTEAALVAAVMLGLLVFFYLQIAAYGLMDSTSTVTIGGLTLYASTSYLLLASVALLLLAALEVGAWYWRGQGVALGGAWLAALVALGLFGLKASWGLSFVHASNARELMLGQATEPEVRVMVEDLRTVSLNQSGDAHQLPITVDAGTGPVIAWYLREFRNQALVEGLSEPPDTMVAVTTDMDDPPIGVTFQGQGFPLRSYWLPWGLSGQDLVRWLLFTDGPPPVVDREVVLWVASTP